MNLKIEDIILAYRKLKSYAYYDNSSIILRKQIIEFIMYPIRWTIQEKGIA